MQKIKLLQAMFGEAYADEYGRNGYVPKDIDLDWALSTLKTREKFVIENLFADKPMTLNEVGKIFPKCNGQRGVSRERIRQIKSNALNKLRHPSRSDRLWPNHPKILFRIKIGKLLWPVHYISLPLNESEGKET